jgi:hypothetical protein
MEKKLNVLFSLPILVNIVIDVILCKTINLKGQ